MKPRYQLHRSDSRDQLAQDVARQWLKAMEGRTGPAWHVALSGGRVAGALFDAVAEGFPSEPAFWDGVHFFWADERCVPPDHDESNYALAQRHLFQRLSLAGDQVHRIEGELGAEQAAKRASETVRRTVPTLAEDVTVLDLILLGMGEDGHVASLFPGRLPSAGAEREPYAAVTGPKPPPERVTMTFPVLAAAKRVWVLISGEGKEGALEDSLKAESQTPLHRVLTMRRETAIYTDCDLRI